MKTFQVHILAADRVFFEGVCESLTVPTIDGGYGIWANHSNIISAVVPGILRYRVSGEEERRVVVSEGLVKIEDNDVLVLVDSAEKPEEVDILRAQRSAEAAKEEMLQKRSIQEYHAAEMQLARAINRLRVKGKREIQ